MVFRCLRFLPKNERRNSTLLLWYLMLTCVRSFFVGNQRHQKNTSKLSDLYYHQFLLKNFKFWFIIWHPPMKLGDLLLSWTKRILLIWGGTNFGDFYQNSVPCLVFLSTNCWYYESKRLLKFTTFNIDFVDLLFWFLIFDAKLRMLFSFASATCL